ncbi:hypothetical protein P167DRAFT_609324 [Morchella conica CCBAS932]|uniref:Uncharacterized protein n=1 Tax=Morchella conica CCBAS932 TaxID=1392247 RepID=A0A3N4KB23_9PEZI|nr:hypothetical protein P167DRAFT_609324 [Morchella conica CCBAS932]
MPVLPHNLFTRSTATAITDAATPAASGLSSRLGAWYHTAGLSDTARDLAQRGTAAAQRVLENEQLKAYADHSVNAAQDAAVWTSELKLDPGYTAGLGQWVSALWAWIVAAVGGVGEWFAGAVSGMGGWFAGIAEAMGPLFESFLGWCSGPQAIRLMIIWVSIVVVVQLLAVVVGFGPAGVVAGSLAAGFQAYAYGAFTPAGGFFAFFTSMGMLGLMMPLGLAAGVVLATLVTIICFLAGVGL